MIMTWGDLAGYVRAVYPVSRDADGLLILSFDLGYGRTQPIFVRSDQLIGDDDEWVVIESIVGQLDDLDLVVALDQAGDMVCGGLVRLGDGMVGIRHAMALGHLDIGEFERSLGLVAASASWLAGQACQSLIF